MMNNPPLPKAALVLPVLFVLSFLPGCASLVTRDDFIAIRDPAKNTPVIIDVRTKSEYESGHITGAVHIPVLSLPFMMSRIPVSSREQKVVVYCAHGPRAGLAGFFLKLSGFSDVGHLEGDFTGWRKGGYPFEKSAGSK